MEDLRPTFIDLFAGIGGFSVGLERAGWRCKAQVEIDKYCRQVLSKHWPHVTRYEDIKRIDWGKVPAVDLVCGGWPCQPFSVAGKRAGAADDRYLWPEVVRCLDVLRPTWFLGENVPGLISLGLDQVLTDLEGLGYETGTFTIPACAVEAPHLRQRVWIVAHTECPRPQGQWAKHQLREAGQELQASGISRWTTEPTICRVAHGIPNRVDRIKAIGNAVVPQVAEHIGRLILDAR